MKKPGLSRRSSVNVMLYVGVLAMAMITYYDYHQRQPEETPQYAFNAADIEAISLHRAGYRTISLQKSGSGWEIRQPIHRRAVDGRVDALLSIGRFPIADAYTASDVNVQELGLDIPQATIELAISANMIAVRFGGKGPHNQRRYLMVDEWIWLADDNYLPLIQGGLNAIADLSLLPASAQPAQIKLPDAGIITDETILTAWQTARASGIAPVEAPALNSDASIKLLTTDGVTHSFALHNSGEYVALTPQNANHALLLHTGQAATLGLID